MDPYDALDQAGLQLPALTVPGGAYVPFQRFGDLLITSGQLPLVDGGIPTTGILGQEVTTEQGADLARICGLNILAIADDVAPSLRDVTVLKLTVFVASAPGYDEQAKVANGASELLNEVLGERGRHARSAVGVAALPRQSPVEVEAILSITPQG